MDANTKLQKFFLEYIDNAGAKKKYIRESLDGEGLDKINLPFHFNKFISDDIAVRLYARIEDSEEITDCDFFKYLVIGDAYEGENKIEFIKRRNQSPLLRNIAQDYFIQPEDVEKDLPEMIYCDITEKEMFGYSAITEQDLCSVDSGIWTMHGFRKIELTIKGLAERNINNSEMKVNMYWNQIDSTSVPAIFETEIRRIKCDNPEEIKFVMFADTNRLGSAFTPDIKSTHPIFAGQFEIHIYYGNTKTVYTFPISLCVHDTRPVNGKNDLLDESIVSIDFGTSSTCVAVKSHDKNQLIPLFGADSDKPFENPTNIMIYRWENIFKQWQAVNKNYPFFVKATGDSDFDDKYAEYEIGEIAKDTNKMSAIITQLKTITQLLAEGKELKFTPLRGKDRYPITITDSIAENNSRTFNPIAFYGYLIGRALNNPIQNKIYGNYQVTFPVNFGKDIREKIRASLEYGIKRALPSSISDDATKILSVQMNYPEPVACIGAIAGKQLKIDNAAKLFAVYDFGGGNLDFSFGMFRKSLNEDEAEESDYFIEVFGIDGENACGSEFLIHELAYKIYLDNRNEMERNRIKFVKPEKLPNPKGFFGLLSERGDYIANGNVNIVKELLARPIFLAKVTDAKQVTLPFLLDKNGKAVKDFNVTVEGVDKFLQEKIAANVKTFKSRLENIFNDNREYMKAAGIENFSVDDVYIFIAGNASKQHYVEEILKNLFAVNNEKGCIQRIGADIPEEELNEKTAVALGQIDIGNYGYISRMGDEDNDKISSFEYNVGYIDSGNGKFVSVIAKGSAREWKQANKIDMTNLTTNLYYTTNMTAEKNSLVPIKADISDFVDVRNKRRSTLFIRINEENSIEYRIGGRKDKPKDNEPIKENMIININRMK
ncbi:MAG: hypothetical protein K6G55_01245 [Selenomonadaceae bacterium]|nr:hypothetical protein [Selenomonadaceae bacterium]